MDAYDLPLADVQLGSPPSSRNFSSAFSKALLKEDYHRSLQKGHGSFSHVMALMKAAESDL